MPKARLKLIAPVSVKRTVSRPLKNKDLRTREHLTEKEVERLIKAPLRTPRCHYSSNRLPARRACLGMLWDAIPVVYKPTSGIDPAHGAV
jgi:hypothetical protein